MPPRLENSTEQRKSTVGASLLAMIVNDNAARLAPRGALKFIASRLAPTGEIGVSNPASA
ncbi:hypothetical protein C1890_06610 [Pseudomonas sp. DP16D-R1]|nr:hypothetical protein C1890_06610 [Pseudomonas sp. DP16D-R1]